MADQPYNKYYQFSTGAGKCKIIWGKQQDINHLDWKSFPHSYSHTGEILFISTEDSCVKCDFEVENENKLNEIIRSYLYAENDIEFYRNWVLAETVAKLIDMPIFEFIKSGFFEKFEFLDESTVKYSNFIVHYFYYKKYHLAFGYPIENAGSILN